MAAADWSKRGEYIAKHGTTPLVANEALADHDAVVLDPDPASKSGLTVRTIGYSPTANSLITVLTLVHEGTLYGVNAWPSNDTDKRRYRETNS